MGWVGSGHTKWTHRQLWLTHDSQSFCQEAQLSLNNRTMCCVIEVFSIAAHLYVKLAFKKAYNRWVIFMPLKERVRRYRSRNVFYQWFVASLSWTVSKILSPFQRGCLLPSKVFQKYFDILITNHHLDAAYCYACWHVSWSVCTSSYMYVLGTSVSQENPMNRLIRRFGGGRLVWT